VPAGDYRRLRRAGRGCLAANPGRMANADRGRRKLMRWRDLRSQLNRISLAHCAALRPVFRAESERKARVQSAGERAADSKGRKPFRGSQRGGRRRSVSRVRRQRRARQAVAVVESALLDHGTIHTAAAARTRWTGGAGRRDGIGRIGRTITAATPAGITARIAAMEQSAAATAGGRQKGNGDEKERETFHLNILSKGSEIHRRVSERQ
jgi:hypothetical protein